MKRCFPSLLLSASFALSAIADAVCVSNGAVCVEARTTGLMPGAICEFPLITKASGHDYEALFVTDATAERIGDALEALGVPKGRPVAPASFRFWPCGERVDVTVSVNGAAPVPVESFLEVRSTKSAPPALGFLYIGGRKGADGAYDVDVRGPQSVLSGYNEPLTLLDVPYRAVQSDVYEDHVAGAAVCTNEGVPVRVFLKPESREAPAAPRRVRDLSLRFAKDGIVADGKGEAQDPVALFAALRAEAALRRQDLYASVSWDGAMTFADLRAAAALLAELDGTLLRVDAPPEAFPYYKAFLPRDEWRDRAKRLSQPCELRLTGDGAKVVAVTERWGAGDALEPEISTEEIPVASPAELLAVLRARTPDRLRVLLAFVRGSDPWSRFAPYWDAVRAEYPMLQLFVD